MVKEKRMNLLSEIKTEEVKDDHDWSGLKKKMEIFECSSPRNEEFNFKFNQTLIKKMMSHQ